MVAVMLIGQQPDLDRKEFIMIQAVSIQPANRLVENKELRKKIINKTKETIVLYSENDESTKKTLTLRKINDWIYSLEELKSALIDIEKAELEKIINEELLRSNKEWFWVSHKNIKIPIYGWKDSEGKNQYYLHEQTMETQTLLKDH